MPSKYRMPATGTDARKKSKPTRAAINTALHWYAGNRPPYKDKPGTRGGEHTGPETTEHFTPNSTPPLAKRGGT
ncbi:MAG: hypothetical protein WCV99_12390 [Sterolibacterium sp.]|jgi:hypothetical protein